MRSARLLVAAMCVLASAACTQGGPLLPETSASSRPSSNIGGSSTTSTGAFGSGSSIPDPNEPVPTDPLLYPVPK